MWLLSHLGWLPRDVEDRFLPLGHAGDVLLEANPPAIAINIKEETTKNEMGNGREKIDLISCRVWYACLSLCGERNSQRLASHKSATHIRTQKNDTREKLVMLKNAVRFWMLIDRRARDVVFKATIATPFQIATRRRGISQKKRNDRKIQLSRQTSDAILSSSCGKKYLSNQSYL